MKRGRVFSAISIFLLIVLTTLFSAQTRVAGGIGTVTVTGPTHLLPGDTGSYTATASSTLPLTTPITWRIFASGITSFTQQTSTLSTTFNLNFGSSTGDKSIVVEALTADNQFIGFVQIWINVSTKTIVTKAILTGPLAGGVNRSYSYTGIVFPLDATPPFLKTWSATDYRTGTTRCPSPTVTVSYMWTAAGNKTVEFIVSNLFDDYEIPDANAPRASMMTNIVQDYQPVTDVSLNGPTTGSPNVPQLFTSQAVGAGGVQPTLPVLFNWVATGQTGYQTVGQTATSTREYVWPNAGVYDVQVQGTNAMLTVDSPTAKRSIQIGGRGTPSIVVDKTDLTFGRAGDAATDDQNITIDNGGSGDLDWNVGLSHRYMYASPSSGRNYGKVNISVDSSSMAPGTHNGMVTISSPSCNPVNVNVKVEVKDQSEDQPPFGRFETPVANGAFQGSIPVTGWALDDVGVTVVKIFGQLPGGAEFYIGDGVFVDGARPDVAQAYPNHPNNTRAGWGYMLLTYGLPNGGNGVVTFYVYAYDGAGQKTLLGSKTITCDNASAVKPFGAVDTPQPGGTAFGTNYVVWLWVLAHMPYMIPIDGSTILVWIDGFPLTGHPTYNIYRSDIAALFPGYANSQGAVGYFYLDSTKYKNGLHTIQVSAVDNAGNANGIGSRYFQIMNSGAANEPAVSAAVEIPAFQAAGVTPLKYLLHREKAIRDIEPSISPLIVARGYVREDPGSPVLPEKDGRAMIVIHEGERVEIRWSGQGDETAGRYSGYLVQNGLLAELPIGSSLSRDQGFFAWQPGPGFLGDYEIVLLRNEWSRTVERKSVIIRIAPHPSLILLPEPDGWWDKLKNTIREALASQRPAGAGAGAE